MRWRIKTATNDELRQRFVDRFAPAARDLGLTIPVTKKDEHGLVRERRPDPEVRPDGKTGHWRFSQPDWDEFYRVIKGNGPLNKQRVGLRRFSYEQGQWVRRAILGSTTLPPGR
jgi:ring-1,2-phenylacetyl-CoA epoxidase subunit PaaA